MFDSKHTCRTCLHMMKNGNCYLRDLQTFNKKCAGRMYIKCNLYCEVRE